MDYLWSPWRYQYIAQPSEPAVCLFCEHPRNPRDEDHWVLHRGRLSFALLNLYPYTTGHLMVAPYEHLPYISDVPLETFAEMARLLQTAEKALRAEYRPDGLNAGINIGKSAGAGVAGHLHLHLLPRWQGDTNFMTAIAETRVLPEDLATTYRKLRPYFDALDR